MSRDREFVFDPAIHGDSVVAEVIELISRKWTRVIIEHLLFHDSMRYSELSEEIDGISDKMLSESLQNLEACHLVDRRVVDDRPVRVEYSLTEPGRELKHVMDAVADWTERYAEAVETAEDAGKDR
ncbi:transcriptional regulator [Salinigranum rubrum]|uniref:Transcriptional regulator n=1 Tax=Salinigranum rubrum TaxID=755307 RepID=A0A2I8VK05_9EURY|nr:helix-turn-helix domain-containing protein [Salinigranum rubrum]AUV82257.1 transcriptional regulator [Salinigranum rubrum]